VAIDRAQAELRVFTALAGDEIWRQAFASGEDIHATTGVALMGDLYDSTKFRTFTKNFTYGLIFGSEGQEIKKVMPRELVMAGITVDDMLKALWQTHPWLFSYRERIQQELTDHRRVINPFGRIRWYPNTPTKKDIRSAVNFPIQSTIADVMHESMGRTDGEIDPERDIIVLQLHDGLYVETEEKRVDTVAQVLKEIMDEPVHSPSGYTFDLPVDVKIGVSLSDSELHKWGEDGH
jgi:DNA polymerase-1